MDSFPVLSLILFLPMAGALMALFLWRRPRACRAASLAVTLAELVLVKLLVLESLFGPFPGRVWVEDLAWVERFGIRYSLMMDGISLVLVLLASFLTVLCVIVSWRQVTERVAAFHFFLLFMQTGVVGVFLATDLFLFYLFWELQLVPMFFLIGVWGHEKRIYATVKFVLFSIAGSLVMLIALIGLYLIHGSQTGEYTFSLARLAAAPPSLALQGWLYAAFFLAFAIKIPLLPVHTWLPDAHTEAPTAGSVILAGLLLKTGVYALLRFGFPLFPHAARFSLPLLMVLGLAGLFYAAWIAFAQSDMKRMVAYSSIAHMGLIVVGLAIWSQATLSGALLQMINHGLTTSALFIMVGMLDERAHTRQLADFGGLWGRMPVFSAFFLLFAMATLGLPGLNNFVGEMLILVGAFQTVPLAGIIGLGGIVFTLIYVLRLVQESLFGPPGKFTDLEDITWREAVILAPLALAVLLIGLYPGPVLELIQAPVAGMLGAGGGISPGAAALQTAGAF